MGSILRTSKLKAGHAVVIDPIVQAFWGLLIKILEIKQGHLGEYADIGGDLTLDADMLVPVPPEGRYWLIDVNLEQSDVDEANRALDEEVEQEEPKFMALWSVELKAGTPRQRRILDIGELHGSGLNPIIDIGAMWRQYARECVLEERADGTWLIHALEE